MLIKRLLFAFTILLIPTVGASAELPEGHSWITPDPYQYEEPLVIEPIKIAKRPDTDLCNCYATLRDLYFPTLPSLNTIVSGARAGGEGDIAVFYYPNSGLYHVAYVVFRGENVFKIDESNYVRCERTQRELPYDYPHLIGFYHN